MESAFRNINNLKYHFNFWGDPQLPKLFLFHGFFDTGASFEFVARELKDRIHLISPDFRGMGKSEWSPNRLGYFFVEYIADVHAILQEFSPEQPCKVVGHSMGANVLSLYAGTYPERISHLVNVEGFGIDDVPVAKAPERVRTWIEGLHEEKPFVVYPTLEALAEKIKKGDPRLTQERALWIAKANSREVDGGVQARFDPKHRWKNPYIYQSAIAEAFWQNIRAKCLLIKAEESEWGNDPEMDRRLSLYPKGSKIITIPASGHMIHHDNPKALANEIVNFLG